MIPLFLDYNHTPQTLNTARLLSSIIFDFLPLIQRAGLRPGCVLVRPTLPEDDGERAQSIKRLTIEDLPL